MDLNLLVLAGRVGVLDPSPSATSQMTIVTLGDDYDVSVPCKLPTQMLRDADLKVGDRVWATGIVVYGSTVDARWDARVILRHLERVDTEITTGG